MPVSIVTPTRNQAAFIEHALRSVAAQTYAPIEHVVVDGVSTDGTVDVLRRHEADGLRWVSEPDSGMYEAVNKGLTMATGEILGYLNSDDALLPWAVEAVVAAFEARPDVDIVYGDGVRLDERTGAQRLRLFPPFDRAAIAAFESLMQPAVFWRRRLTDRIGPFDASLRFVGDLDYWLRAGPPARCRSTSTRSWRSSGSTPPRLRSRSATPWLRRIAPCAGGTWP